MDTMRSAPAGDGTAIPDDSVQLGTTRLWPRRVVPWVLDNVPPPPNPPVPVPAVNM